MEGKEELERQVTELAKGKEQLEARMAELQCQVTHMPLLLQDRQSLMGPEYTGTAPACLQRKTNVNKNVQKREKHNGSIESVPESVSKGSNNE